ncbi:MAG: IscS subfamily cysteine desulfurase [Alteromonadaceae bacterium]|nr:MAG: IscS subfamily cysteine desulfurase [Alteromonadaceae bacterium]
MTTPVYLDYAATTPVDPRVAEKMAACLTREGNFANPASRSHVYGWKAEEAVEDARASVAELIGADVREIVWTSGATEANNLAIKGVVERNGDGERKHIISSLIEHKSVLDTCEYLQSQGCELTLLKPDSRGVISAAQVADALREDTLLVSLMMVNNEVGAINDIAAIGALCRDYSENKGSSNGKNENTGNADTGSANTDKPLFFHVDAVQGAGKLVIDVKAMQVDLLSISAHKMYGPKGIGVLYVSKKPLVKVAQQIHGGGHERGMRSGTLATHQIVGMGEAAAIALQEMHDEQIRISHLKTQLLDGLSCVEELQVNGDPDCAVPGIVNIGIAYVEGESLLIALRDLALSTGSACTSVSVEPSYVLKALGLSAELAHASLRISIGRYTSEQEIAFATEQLINTVAKLRQISPQWQARQAQIQTTAPW